MLSKDSIQFLDDLKTNNNRDWFLENKKRYEVFKKDYHKLVANFLDKIKPLDSSLKMLEVKNNEVAGQVLNLGHFPKLIHAELQNNYFTVLLPMKSESLQILYLERNHIAGELPKLEMPELTRLDLN